MSKPEPYIACSALEEEEEKEEEEEEEEGEEEGGEQEEEEGFEDPWLFFEAKGGPRAKSEGNCCDVNVLCFGWTWRNICLEDHRFPDCDTV